LRKVERYLLALALAAFNDALDMLAIFQPIETLLDVATAFAIMRLLQGRFSLWRLLILLFDLLPFFDVVPLWSLYVAYIIMRDREFWEGLVQLIVK